MDETWEVEVGSKRYQARLETIETWLREGRVQPTDRARKPGFDWTALRLIPQLRGIEADERLIADQATRRIREQVPEVPGGERTCEACAEEIRAAALKCRYCGNVSMQPEWQEFYRHYSMGSDADRHAYWAVMEEPERNYLRRIGDFNAQVLSAETRAAGPMDTPWQDYSRWIGYRYSTSEGGWGSLFAENEEQARELVRRGLPPEAVLSELEVLPIGKFSCPRCGNRYTSSQREIGCAILTIIFISFGLGLIMIPLLPHACECFACGHRWKA